MVGGFSGTGSSSVRRDFDDTGAEIEKEQRSSGRYAGEGESG